MCGIVGALVYGDGPFRVTAPYVDAMRDTMVMRGPDGDGTWISDDGRIGLGHRRLAIIDLSEKAAQPMSAADGQVRITFNGEIYNHREIRAELESAGESNWLTDHSDTEVILRAYLKWGVDCLAKFRGMFAFAIWDGRSKELWLVRDRIGVKPLYYARHHGRFTFASEIKALLADPEQPRQVDETALFHYFSFVATPAPSTLFSGIHKVPPGTWLRVAADGRVTERRYWDVWDHTEPLTGISDAEIAERVREELRAAVRYRKESDVPVGVFLSGGIDSSTNTALFSEDSDTPVKTFCIGYKGEHQSYTNEFDYARMIAKQVGAEHYELSLDQDDLIDFLPHMIELQDEPIADPVCVPVYFVSKLARDNGVTVAQVGEGADELFFGYESWQRYLRLQRLDNLPVPKFAKKLALAGIDGWGRQDHPYREMLRRGINDQPVFWCGADLMGDAKKRRVMSPRLREQTREMTSWDAIEPLWRRFQDAAWDRSPINWMGYVDLNLRLPELLLMRVDKMSMGVSLEGRVPFLDHKLVELAMSIPAHVRYQNGNSKHILKKAVRGIIPDALIDRRKQGFGVPVNEWFFDRLGDHARGELEDFCRKTDYLDPIAVNDLIERRDATSVWALLNFALWWKRHIEQTPLRTAA